MRHLNAIAGVEITASHNPSQYNGYKVYWEDGGQLPPPRAAEVTAIMDKTSFEEALPMDERQAIESGLVSYISSEVDDAYIAEVKKLQVNPELAREMGKTLKIVYTPLNGTGNIPVRRILREIGMENVYVVPEQEMPDGRFPQVNEPHHEDKGAYTLAIALQHTFTEKGAGRIAVGCGGGVVDSVNGYGKGDLQGVWRKAYRGFDGL